MPTWRSNKIDFLTEALPDLVKLNNVLIKNNLTLFIKLHPNEINLENDLSNILFINPRTDIYELLPLTQFLITDYSSIYFDYLLLDKEVIFYPFDLENYLNDERELYFNYDEKTPGTKVYNFEELLLIFSNLNSLNFKKQRESIKDEFWSYQDDNASMRITNYFRDKVL
jgi:CDP-glycerol glycerophosphotransferase (TagB/SpsB family)